MMNVEAPAPPAAAAAADLDNASAKVEAMDIEEKKEEFASSDEPQASSASAAAAAAAVDKSGDDGDDAVDMEGDDADEDKDTPPGDATATIAVVLQKKEEGNAAFQAGDYAKAVRSYRKGTILLKAYNKKNTGDDQIKCLLVALQTNLSMVYHKQEKHKLSRDVASSALEIDRTSVKALYRRAVALRKLGDAESARDDLKAALKIEPNNRAVRTEFVAIKKQVEASRAKEKERLALAFSAKSGSSFLYDDKEEEERRKAEEKKRQEEAEAEALKKRKVEWEDECVRRMSNNEEAISFDDWQEEQKKKQEEDEKARKKAKKEEEERRKAERNAAKAAAKDDVVILDDELTEKELAMMRGYKKTSDGRTTSYFTREVSAEEKALLEQAAGPKLIGSISTNSSPTASSATSPLSATAPTSSGVAAASAWNQAGTWEEKNTTEWCTSCLKRHLRSATVDIPTSSYTAKITQVNDLTGDASVVLTRGKKRYVFDYHLSVSFDVIHISEGISADDIDENEADESTSKAETVVATGALKLPDISSTVTIQELEIEPSSAWKKSPSNDHSVGVMECRGVLIEAVRDKVRSFVDEFNAQY